MEAHLCNGMRYNNIAMDDDCYYIFFDGYGLYTFWASDYELLDSIELKQDDNFIEIQHARAIPFCAGIALFDRLYAVFR